MPPKYYAFINGEQKGPYTLDQLIDAGVRPSTYVWCKDMDDWHRADEVEEIRNLFRRHVETHNTRAVNATIVPPAHQPGVTPDARPPEPTGEAGREDNPPRMRFPLPETEIQEDLSRPPQVSMTLAILSLLLCFPPTGFVAVFFTYKAQKIWEEAMKDEAKGGEELKRRSHEYERLSKMWLGLTVAFGIIFWTLIFSVRK